MRDQDKSKEELLQELSDLRRQLAHISTDRLESKQTSAALRQNEAPPDPIETASPLPGVSNTAGNEQIEAALLESQERLKILFEFAPDAYYINDLAGCFVDGNRAAEQLTGYNKAELIGKSFLELNLLPPQEIQKATEALNDNRRGQMNGPEEFTLIRRDGSQVMIEVRTFPVKIKGQPLVLGIARDITERKRVENALRESRQHYQSLVEAMPQALYRIDLEGKITFGNRAFLESLGISLAECLGKTLHNFFPKNLADRYRAHDQQVIQTGQSQTFVEPYTVLPTDKNIYIEVVKTPVRNFAGEIVGLQGIYWDVTGRLKLEQALRESEKRYRQAVENSPNPIFAVNREGFIHLWNQACQRVFQYDWQEVIGRSYRDILWDTAEFLALEALLSRVFRQQSFNGVEVSYRSKSGVRRFTISRLYPLLDETGLVQGCVFANTDITERKEMEAELQRMVRQAQQDAIVKADLLKEVNHRVKNNLMAISGLILAEQNFTQAEAGSAPTMALERLNRRVRGLLEAHHLLAQSNWAPVSLSDLVYRITRLVLNARPADQHVEVKVAPASIQVSPRQASDLALIVNELVINTIKYALPAITPPETASISAQFTLEDSLIQFEYRDNGPGYPQKVMDFIRVSMPDPGASGWTPVGVGLYLVRGIVTGTLRGELRLDNNGGAGTTIYFKSEVNSAT